MSTISKEKVALPPLRFSAVRLLIARNVLEQNLSHQIHGDSHSSAAKLEKLLSLLSQSQEPSLAPSIVTTRDLLKAHYLYFHHMHVCVCGGACHGARMEVRGQLAGLSFLLPPREFWVLNSDCQALEQSSCYSPSFFFSLSSFTPSSLSCAVSC